jgi:hypothetical protein
MLFFKRCKNKVGELPHRQDSISECYSKIDTIHRWQGDLFRASDFENSPFPQSSSVPFWMLINRTCHLVEGDGRKVKLPFLNFVAVYKVSSFLSPSKAGKPTIQNQIKKIVSESELVLFLPECETFENKEPLVANFNLMYSVPLDDCPPASEKIAQLSSPFCEHALQKFSSFVYTVGFDDSRIKSKDYLDELSRKMEEIFEKK